MLGRPAAGNFSCGEFPLGTSWTGNAEYDCLEMKGIKCEREHRGGQ